MAKNYQPIAMLFTTGLHNVVLPTLFHVVNNIKQDHSYTQNRKWTERSLESEPLKFMSPRMSQYACSLCRLWPVNCIFWPMETLDWLFRHYSGQSIAYKLGDMWHCWVVLLFLPYTVCYTQFCQYQIVQYCWQPQYELRGQHNIAQSFYTAS